MDGSMIDATGGALVNKTPTLARNLIDPLLMCIPIGPNQQRLKRLDRNVVVEVC